jgi:hypothetical protein
MSNIDKLLHKLYYTDLNFDGVNELYRKSKLINSSISKKDVSTWLKNQSVSQQTASKPIQKPEFKPIYSDSFYGYQIDLTFLNQYKSSNNGYTVLFTAININSRYLFVYYSKSKSSDAILKMLEEFKKNAIEIDTITGDLDSGFNSNECLKWFNDNNIKTFFFKSDSHKLGIVNRVHRTIKEKLLKYFVANDTTTWIDIIDKIVNNYNNTVNRGIGCTPKEASNHFIQTNLISDAIEKTNKIKLQQEKNEIKIGDKCRLKQDKKIFDKMQIKYSNDIYVVIKVNKNTVNIENDNHILNNIKKDNILIINDINNNKKLVNKPTVEKQAKVIRKLNQEGIKEDDVIKEKRVRKSNNKYDI